MKKFGRCFACNNIHHGVKPPEICPTCMAKNAYVEIFSVCGGQLRTPTFLNTKAKDVICDEVEYEKLKNWAKK